MSGVIIDVDARAGSANRDLEKLNRNLAQIVNTSKQSKNSIQSISADNLRGVADNFRKTTDAAKDFGATGTKSLNNVSRAGSETATILNNIKNAAIGVGVAFAALKGFSVFNKANDDLTLIQNKLRLVTKGTADLISTQKQLLTLSQETRSDYGTTINIYSKFSKALESTGMSQERLIKITRTLNQAAALSGGSIESTNAAFLQLSQGISSGALRGEELNSVLEQIPYLGQEIAKQLNMSTGALRKFAEEGKLTPERVVKALENMANKTAEDFGKTTITVAEAFLQLRQAVSITVGEINKFLGFSDKFAKKLSTFAKSLSGASDSFTVNLFNIRESIKNYIRNFDVMDAFDLTVKGVINFDISPIDAYTAYKQYERIKYYLAELKTKLGFKTDINVEDDLSSLKKVFDVFENLFNIDVGAGFTNVQKAIESFKTAFDFSKNESSAKRILQILDDTIGLIVNLVDSVVISARNLLGMVPLILTPIETIGTKARRIFSTTVADAKAFGRNFALPIKRSYESVAEFIGGYAFSDQTLERAWSNLFRSKSLKEFNSNLLEVNKQRAQFRFSDINLQIAEFNREIKGTAFPIRRFLISINVLDNKLLSIRDTRFDRVVRNLTDVYLVIKRIYEDFFKTEAVRFLDILTANIKALAETFVDAFEGSFNESTGKRTAKALVRGLKAVFSTIQNLFKEVDFAKAFSDSIAGLNANFLIKSFKAILNSLLLYFKGFFKEIISEVADADLVQGISKRFTDFIRRFQASIRKVKADLADIVETISSKFGIFNFKYNFDLDDSLFKNTIEYFSETLKEILEYTKNTLNKVEKRISQFAQTIKDYFFDIYDKVVGNSYWPDMIDGVVNYTSNLFKADSVIVKFANKVKGLFKALYKDIINSGTAFGKAFETAIEKLSNLNISSTVSLLAQNIGAGLLADAMFLFGGPKLKLAALTYFTGVFNFALGGAFSSFTPLIAKTLGASGGALAQGLVAGLYTGLEAFIQALPDFVASFIKSFGGVGEVLYRILSFFPIFNNNIALAAVGISALYAKFGGGAGLMRDLWFGKEATKKSPAKEGIVDYLKAILGFDKTIQEKGSEIFKGMFNSNKLALVAAGIFSTALLESVSLIEAASIGLPILAFAILGKDGGARLIRDVETAGLKIAAGAYKRITSFVVNKFGKESLISKIFEFPSTLEGRAAKGGEKLANSYGVNILKGFRQIFVNLRENADEYAKGNISIFDAMFNSITRGDGFIAKLPNTKLKENFQKLFSDLGSIKVGDTDLGSIFTSIYNTLASGFTNLKPIVIDFFNNFVKFAGKTLSNIKTVLAGALSGFVDSLSFLFGLLKNRLVLFGILTAGIVGIASAADRTSNSLTDLGSSVSTTTKLILALTTAIAGFYAISKLTSAFKAGKESIITAATGVSSKDFAKNLKDTIFIKTSEYVAAYDKESDKRKQAYSASLRKEIKAMAAIRKAEVAKQRAAGFSESVISDYVASFKDVTRSRLKDFEEGYFKKEKKSFQAGLNDYIDSLKGAAKLKRDAEIDAIPDLNKAGWESVKNTLFRFSESVSDMFLSFGKGVIAFLRNPLKTTSELIDSFKNKFGLDGLFKTNTSSAAKFAIAADSMRKALELIRAGNYAEAFKAIGEAIKLATKATFAGKFTDFISSLFNLKNIAGVFRSVGTSILAILAPFAKFIALGAVLTTVVAAVGALGIYLFGPGDTFQEKLGWAYDKVRALFGLKPTTAGGKKAAIDELVSGIDVGDKRINFRATVGRVDFEKMSGKQFEVYSEVASNMKQTLDSLNTLYIKQGSLTDSQLAELEKVTKEFEDITARQPQLPQLSFREQIDEFVKFNLSAQTVGESVKDLSNKMTFFDKALSEIGKTLSLFLIMGAVAAAVGLLITGLAGVVIAGAVGLVIVFSEELDKATDYLLGGLSKIFNYLGEMIPKGINAIADDIKKFFDFGSDKRPPSEGRRQEVVKADIKSIELGLYFDELTPDLQKVITAAKDEYAKAVENYYNELENGQDEKKLKAFNAELERTRAIYFSMAETYGKFGRENAGIKAMRAQLKALSSASKDLLDLDLGGEFAEGFFGGKNDIANLTRYQDKVRDLNKVLERTYKIEERRQLLIQKASLQREAKALTDRVLANAFTKDKFEFQIKLTEDVATLNALARLRASSEDTYKSFSDTANQLDEVEKELANFSAERPFSEFVALTQKSNELKKALNQKLPATIFIDDLNNRLQKLGLQTIDPKRYIYLNEKSLNSIKDATERATKAQISYVNALKDPNSRFDQIIESLKAMTEALNGAAAAVANAEADVGKELKGNSLERARQIGLTIPETVGAKGEASRLQWVKLQADLKAAQARLNELQTTSEGTLAGATKEATMLNAEVNRLKLQIENLESIFVVNFDTIISRINEAGISLNKFEFGLLTNDVQKRLREYTVQLESISKTAQRTNVISGIGSVILDNITREAQIFKEIRELLFKEIYKTGEQLATGLGRLGISTALEFNLFDESGIERLLLLDQEIQSLRAQLKNPANSKRFLEIQNALAKAERSARIIRGEFTNFEQTLGIVNDIFKLNLDEETFELLSDPLKIELGESAKRFQEDLKQLREGPLLKDDLGSLIQSLLRSREAAKAVEPAVEPKEGEPRLLPQVPVTATSDLFAKIRSDAFKQATNIFNEGSAYAVELSKILTETQDQLISRVTAAYPELEDFRESLKRLSMDDLLELSASSVQLKKTLDGANLGLEGFTQSRVFQERREGTTKALGMLPNAQNAGLQTAFKRIDMATLQPSTINRLSDSWIKQLQNLAKEIETESLAVSSKPTEQERITAQNLVNAKRRQLDMSLIKASVDTAQKAFDAGKSFASAISDGTYSAINDAFKGKAIEGKGVLESLALNLADLFTNAIIDSFIKGMTDPFLGEGGVLSEFMQNLGTSLYKSATNQIFGAFTNAGISTTGLSGSPITSAPVAGPASETGKEQTDLLSSIFTTLLTTLNPVGGFFTSLITGVLSLFGVQFSSVTQQQIQFIYYSNLLVLIQGTLIGISGILTAILTRVSLDNPAFATGGYVRGPGTGTSDSIMARISNGEFVVNARATRDNFELLKAINAGKIKKYAQGGLVSRLDMPNTVDTRMLNSGNVNSNSQIVNINITGDISRQTRAEIVSMAPEISAMVHSNFKERRVL